MHAALPPLTALRAFEAAARHLSLTKAAAELGVTPGALSHQIRGLEDFLGLELFHRRPRAIALTDVGGQLYPGLQAGFSQIRQALAGVGAVGNDRILVVSTPPGFTAKWLAPRLYRFLSAHPGIDTRISSTLTNADFRTDGVDVAVRHMRAVQIDDPELLIEKLTDQFYVPVCSPRFLEQVGGLANPAELKRLALIHDDSLAGREETASWTDWLALAGVKGIDVSRGLRFNTADHAIQAAIEGAGILLAQGLLAHDDLRNGRLVAPFDLTLPSRRAVYFVCPKGREKRPNVKAFREWVKAEMVCHDFGRVGQGPPTEVATAASPSPSSRRRPGRATSKSG